MKYLSVLVVLFFTFPAMAMDAPVLTFERKVEIVVEAKKDPVILDLKLDQKDHAVLMKVIVDKNANRDQAKKIAFNLVMLAKSLSLDDKPTDDKTIGKGLYDYTVTINRVDGIMLLKAKKPAKKKKLSFDLPVEVLPPVQIKPWTREDANPR